MKFRPDRHRDKTSVVLVALTLTAAILVAASLLIFTGTRRSGLSMLDAPSSVVASRPVDRGVAHHV